MESLARKSRPAESKATSQGKYRVAFCGSPPSPEKSESPVPTTVVMIPALSILRMRWLPTSATYTLPSASFATTCQRSGFPGASRARTGSGNATYKDVEIALHLLATGAVKPFIGAVLPFPRASEGHAMMEQRAVVGRVVLSGW